jgi:hypothetical protein
MLLDRGSGLRTRFDNGGFDWTFDLWSRSLHRFFGRFYWRLFDSYSACAMVVPTIAVGRFDSEAEPALDGNSNVLIDRAGVGLLFLHAELGQQLENPVRLHFQLPRQLVDPDLQLHR